MNFKLRHLAAATILASASLSLSALAAPISLGTNPNNAAVVGLGVASTPITWSYSFTLDSVTNFSDIFLTLRSTDPVDYALTLTGPTSLTAAVTGGLLITADHTFSSLADGAYVLSIVGTPTSSWSAAYGGSLTATAAPVPEPESLALVLAGLGVAGTLVRRRKNG